MHNPAGLHKLRRDRSASMTGNRRVVGIFAPLPSSRHMRAPVDTIPAPPFPQGLEWVNVATLRMDKQRGRPVLIEFFDFCRPNSLRTLPYVRAWHERYAEAGAGLRVVSVHCPGFPPGADADTVRAAVARLGIEHPVVPRPRLRAVARLRQRGLARALPLRRRPAAVRVPRRRGRLRGDRAGDPGAARRRRRARRPGASRGRARRADRRPDARPARRLLGPLRGGRGVGRASRARERSRVNGAPVERRRARRASASCEHPHHTEGVLELEPGAGVDGATRRASRRESRHRRRERRRADALQQAHEPRRLAVVEHDRVARPVRAAGARRRGTCDS